MAFQSLCWWQGPACHRGLRACWPWSPVGFAAGARPSWSCWSPGRPTRCERDRAMPTALAHAPSGAFAPAWHFTPSRRADVGTEVPLRRPRASILLGPCAARLHPPSAAALGPHCRYRGGAASVLAFQSPLLGRLRARRNTSAVSGFQLLVPTVAGGHRQPAQFRAGTTRPPGPKDGAAAAACHCCQLSLLISVAAALDSVCCRSPAGVLRPSGLGLFGAFTICACRVAIGPVVRLLAGGSVAASASTTARSSRPKLLPAVAETCPGGPGARAAWAVAE